MLTHANGPQQRHQRCHRPASPALTQHGHGGAANRVGVGVDPRPAVRLDTDRQTDPRYSLTAQVRRTPSEPGWFPTHTHVWGVPPGAAHA